jgi:hypothetical protein
VAFAVAALKEAGANMPFDFCQDTGYARLSQPDLPPSTMKIQLFGEGDYGAEIVKFQRRTAAHRKIASIDGLAPGLTKSSKDVQVFHRTGFFSTIV